MSTAPRRDRFTPSQYLAIERQAETRHEFFAGEIFAMAGAGRAHNLIVANLARLLGNQLVDRPCELYQSEMRVLVEATGMYTYPDVVISCGEPRFQDDVFDTLLNPTLIVEVLSPSTESYDRGKKFAHYRSIPSLREYVMVDQESAAIEVYRRQDDQWILRDQTDLEQSIRLESIACDLPLHEVYAKVEFPPPKPVEHDKKP